MAERGKAFLRFLGSVIQGEGESTEINKKIMFLKDLYFSKAKNV